MAWEDMDFLRKGQRGVLNAAGDVVTPPVYDNVFYANFRYPDLFRVTLNGVTVMRDSAGAIYPDIITYPALQSFYWLFLGTSAQMQDLYSHLGDLYYR